MTSRFDRFRSDLRETQRDLREARRRLLAALEGKQA